VLCTWLLSKTTVLGHELHILECEGLLWRTIPLLPVWLLVLTHWHVGALNDSGAEGSSLVSQA